MFHTVVLDNFFENLNEVIDMSKKFKYYKPSKKDNWGGTRTKPLDSKYYNFCNNIVLKILGFYFPNSQIKYRNTSVLFCKMNKGDNGKTRFHRDKAILAAVIYLFNGDMQSGTTIFFNEKEKQIVVGAKLNTMVAYDGKKIHGFTSLNNLKEERLTLNVFIRDIEVLPKNEF